MKFTLLNSLTLLIPLLSSLVTGQTLEVDVFFTTDCTGDLKGKDLSVDPSSCRQIGVERNSAKLRTKSDAFQGCSGMCAPVSPLPCDEITLTRDMSSVPLH